MNDEKKWWLDDPKNVNKIVYTLYAVCVALIFVDAFYHKHLAMEHEWVGTYEKLWGSYGIYGLVSCVLLVLAAKGMRRVVMRGEDYYDG